MLDPGPAEQRKPIMDRDAIGIILLLYLSHPYPFIMHMTIFNINRKTNSFKDIHG